MRMLKIGRDDSVPKRKQLSTENSDALTFLQKIIEFQRIGYAQKHPIIRDKSGNYYTTMEFVGGEENDPLGIEEFLGREENSEIRR